MGFSISGFLAGAAAAGRLFSAPPRLVTRCQGVLICFIEAKPVTGFAIIDAWISDSPWRDEMLVSAIRHMVLPVLTLSVAPTTEVIRLMRISTIEVFDQNYVKAAATRGLSRLTILRRHVLHNALPPVIPRLGLQFSALLQS
ncbi:ABC transporter permease subunit [Klebsiella pneumoniae]|uniref:ABC transporter permease subunit n=1 Tax=Klebsiella pneumoniae TaxID=573 RepID=UPI003D553482